ncbi:RecX family transcriptional regulator [Leucobacter sp. cx-42]|uniref:regulatory protein RecX n=1 Tax=unclassified Leucobacter TaxID=2621730 RepID=UPI00165E11F9|nr:MULTISPECIES: regulatory protein RecX [unclassified Leucobacter]MBC9954243.1 RecX family transcriptional regulator [Leucobacter sp. cx-42]
MVVRFLPVPDGEPAPARPDRENFAEVVELRARFSSSWATPAQDDDAFGESSVEDAVDAPSMLQAGRLVSAASLRGDASSHPAAEREDADNGVVSLASHRKRKSSPHADAMPGSEANASVAATPEPAAPKRQRAASRRVAEDETEDVAEAPLNDIDEDVVRLMAKKARSSGELQRELVLLGHLEFDAEDAVARAVEALYVDDEGLARAVCTKLRDGKGASRSQIRQKLRDRKLPDSAIELVLDELDEEDEDALLRETAFERARKMGSLDRATAERRLLGFLARRGWGGEAARRAVRDALDGGVQRRGGSGRSGGVRFQ